jgi:hypothetical protein
MNYKIIISLTIIFVSMILMLFNKKIRCLSLIKDAFSVFKNNKTKKIYWYDILTFFICPIAISITITIGFNYYFNNDMAEILLNVFSILFTLLFGVTSILTSNIQSSNNTKRFVSKEAFAIASFSMLISMLNLIFLIVYSALLQFYFLIYIYQVLTACVITLSLIMIMLLLLVIKRSYITFTAD